MYKISYFGDGAQTEFGFAFPFFQNGDVRVALNEVVLDAGTYGVVPNDTFTGGTVVFDEAPAPDIKIDIFRRVELSRVIDYQPTAKIDPEDLNNDFNFLLAALQDMQAVDVDLAEWSNIHDNVTEFMRYTNQIIQDKLSGGGVLGLYNNLLAVLAYALPCMINDYGCITDTVQDEDCDDYGVL